jgi:hypothetical protein
LKLMTSLRRLAVLLLCAANAAAQVEVRPLALPVSAPRALALPVALPSLPAPSLSALPAASLPALPAPAAAPAAAPVAAPVAAPAAAAPLPPVQARAAALTGALAEFAKTDLKAASASDARGAGEALMRRALGEGAPAGSSVLAAPHDSPAPPLAAPGPAAAPAAPRIYLLSKPLRETVSLGPLSLVAHLGYALSWEALKAFAGWKATGSPMGALAVLAVELPFSPAMVTGRSLLDLGQRYWRRKLAVLREIARAPGVERVRVLTTGEAEFWGPVAYRKRNTGLIFVESAGGLPEEVGRFGAPIPIADAAARTVRMTLVQDGRAVAEWLPTLADLLAGRPIPPETAADWRAALKGAGPKSPVGSVIKAVKGKELSVEASLLDEHGGERELGPVAYGGSVRSLIGLGRLDRLRSWLGRPLPARAIHLSDSRVERPGAAREPGLAAALKRAWRRVAGRLIVAPEVP